MIYPVTSIEFGVFYGVDLQIVVSLIENPFTIDGQSTDIWLAFLKT